MDVFYLTLDYRVSDLPIPIYLLPNCMKCDGYCSYSLTLNENRVATFRKSVYDVNRLINLIKSAKI